MPRTARLIDALRGCGAVRGRGKALVFTGAAAALVGAGAAGAATAAQAGAAPAGAAATVSNQAALTGGGAPASLAPQAHAQTTAVLDPAAGPGVRHTAEDVSARGADTPVVRGDVAPARPYEIYDSVTPSAIPAGHEIATYADGPFAVSPSSVAGKQVLWIDTNGSDPHASALDVEPGDVTPTQAGSWAAQKLQADPSGQAIIYTMQSEWPSAQAAVQAAVPAAEQSHVRWWIADPTGVPHMVPGSSATQWYWGSSYDISTANPGF
jgi:hypothetical protein